MRRPEGKTGTWLVIALLGCGSPANEDAGMERRDAAVAVDARADVDARPGLDASGSVDASGRIDAAGDAGPSELALPPANAPLDYQLGGAYPPPDGVAIVVRDRSEAPAAGLYNVCYVNGFQIQPGEEGFWMSEEPDLILRDGAGDPIIDPDWDEMLIDVGTPEKRARVAAIVGGWIAGCDADGFDAVEIDNLDSFSRSGGRLAEDDAVATMALFAAAAHARGMPIAQKNAAELVGRRVAMQTDFVVAEECNRYDECDVYTGAYGEHVLVIEYRRADFDAGCAAFPELSIVLRDLELVTPSSSGYLFDGC